MSKKDVLKRYNYGIEIETSRRFSDEQKTYLDKHFKARVVHDGSIDGEEINSPIVPGEEVEKWVDEICAYLASIDMTVNKRCGLHIHVSLRYMPSDNIKFFKSLLSNYKYYEPAMYAMMPPSRAKSQWCGPVAMSFAEIEKIANENALYKYYYREKRMDEKKKASLKRDRYCSSRYQNLNLHSWFYRGTLEIRMHSGTVNPIKIKNWIYINTALIEKSAQDNGRITSYKRQPEISSTVSSLKDVTSCYCNLGSKSYQEIYKYIDDRVAKFNPEVEESSLAANSAEPVTIIIKRRTLMAGSIDDWEEVSCSMLFKDIKHMTKELAEFVETYKMKLEVQKEEWIIDDLTIPSAGTKTEAKNIATAISSKVAPKFINCYSAV